MSEDGPNSPLAKKQPETLTWSRRARAAFVNLMKLLFSRQTLLQIERAMSARFWPPRR
jgi:hypothetical protein